MTAHAAFVFFVLSTVSASGAAETRREATPTSPKEHKSIWTWTRPYRWTRPQMDDGQVSIWSGQIHTHATRTPHGDTATATAGLGHSRGCAAEIVERPRHLRRKAKVSELDIMVVVRRREQQAKSRSHSHSHSHFHSHFHARRSSRRGGVGRTRGVIRTMAPRHDPPPPRPSPELKRSGEIVS